ncbi:hypothetical protein NPIL_57901, partial [Nephila pilipes]
MPLKPLPALLLCFEKLE